MWVWAIGYSSYSMPSETASGNFWFNFFFFFQRKNIFHFQNEWKFPIWSSPSFFVLYTPIACVGIHVQVFFFLPTTCLLYFLWRCFGSCESVMSSVTLRCFLSKWITDMTRFLSLWRSLHAAGNMFSPESNLQMKILWWNPVILNIC